MDFAAAWEHFQPGDSVQVSDGSPEPSVQGGFPWKVWRSHNFSGTLVEKVDGPPRALRIELPPTDSATVSYSVQEGWGHEFS